ncbi:phosphotransferase [Streptomyces sp. NPDC007107]|uniref:phosphotransferase n=1 Tax=Streptomyces sp. NPDC007107 TaxID=3156915 RepID=UPI0033F1EF57
MTPGVLSAVAFIDFDMARPGDPLEDLGYMTWTWCISSRPQAPPARAQAAQVRTLADGYGLDASAAARTPGSARVRARIDWSRREHAYTAENRNVFASALR